MVTQTGIVVRKELDSANSKEIVFTVSATRQKDSDLHVYAIMRSTDANMFDLGEVVTITINKTNINNNNE